MGGVDLRGVRGNLFIFIDSGGGAPKTSISAENSVKIDFLALFADFHPAFRAARHLTPLEIDRVYTYLGPWGGMLPPLAVPMLRGGEGTPPPP